MNCNFLGLCETVIGNTYKTLAALAFELKVTPANFRNQVATMTSSLFAYLTHSVSNLNIESIKRGLIFYVLIEIHNNIMVLYFI